MVETIRINRKNISCSERSVACIGYFDGMHKGHQKLIRETVLQAEKTGCIPALICFDPDPSEVILNRKQEHLFSDEERYAIASSMGIEKIMIIPFDRDFMELSASGFIRECLEQMNLKKLICGCDFSFGKGAEGDADLLKNRSSFETIVVAEERYEGRKISSTWIKETVKEGNFSLSEKLLGFPYYFILDVTGICPNGQKQLTECVLHDKGCIIPNEGEYKNLFTVKDGCFLIENDRYEIKETIRIDTVAYE